MEKMYGPPPRVPQGFSQLDADTESKKNAIGLVMASGLDYKRAVELLEYCEGDVELALNKLEKAQIRESTNDVRKPPQPHAVRAAGWCWHGSFQCGSHPARTRFDDWICEAFR